MMNRIAILLVALILPLFAERSVAQTIQPAKVNLTQGYTNAYLIKAGEVTVNGDLIKRVELGKSTAVITYFNKSTRRLQPKYLFRLIDAYGFELTAFSIEWLILRIGPGETEKENVDFSTRDLYGTLQFSTIALPGDWATPIWLVIEDSTR